eukprot:14042961-Heterocapsa_arctica.AAC.1
MRPTPQPSSSGSNPSSPSPVGLIPSGTRRLRSALRFGSAPRTRVVDASASLYSLGLIPSRA